MSTLSITESNETQVNVHRVMFHVQNSFTTNPNYLGEVQIEIWDVH